MATEGTLVVQGFGLACLLAGAGFIALTGVGLLRLPDMLCRSHAVSKGMTLGMFLMLAGYWCVHEGPGLGWRVGLAIVFQALTTPIASHLLARAALLHRTGGAASEPRGQRKHRRTPGRNL